MQKNLWIKHSGLAIHRQYEEYSYRNWRFEKDISSMLVKKFFGVFTEPIPIPNNQLKHHGWDWTVRISFGVG